MSENTTIVTIELDHTPTIEDIQNALDTFRAEGIHDTFTVDVVSTTERTYIADVPYDQRPERVVFRMTAARASRTKAPRLSATAEFMSAP